MHYLTLSHIAMAFLGVAIAQAIGVRMDVWTGVFSTLVFVILSVLSIMSKPIRGKKHAKPSSTDTSCLEK